MPSILICDPTLSGRPEEYIDVTLNIQMENCRGKTLREFLNSRPRLNFRDAGALRARRSENISIFSQLLRGVSHFHQYGIIHRDLKPSNIFME